MYLNVFEYRLRPDADIQEWIRLAEEMSALVAAEDQFEFVDLKHFATSDTEGVILERFASINGATAWIRDARHRDAMRRGKQEFYAWYRGYGCIVDHEYCQPRPPADE